MKNLKATVNLNPKFMHNKSAIIDNRQFYIFKTYQKVLITIQIYYADFRFVITNIHK